VRTQKLLLFAVFNIFPQNQEIFLKGFKPKKGKIFKRKIHLKKGQESPRGGGGGAVVSISTLHLTSALDGVRINSTSWPFYPREKETEWVPGPVRTCVKNLARTGIQPVASRHTD